MKKRRFLLIALMCCFVFAGSILVACNGEDSDFTVSFDTQGGSNIAGITVGNGQVIGEVAPPTKQCARFIGFALDAGGERMWNLQTDTVSANITLYAIWEDAHTWGGTVWEYDENYHWKICSRCGAVFEKTAHVYDTDGKCECGAIAATPASEFTFTDLGNNTWSVDGYSGSDSAIVIPLRYNGGKVISIGDEAFEDCTGLTSVTILDGVTSIGDRAFYDCTGLTSITIPNSVTSIGSYAFSSCTKLTSITIPDGATSIGAGAFDDCTGLTEINWNAVSVADFDDYNSNVFYNAGVAGDGITVTFGDSVQRIPACAFRYCTGLTSVTIGEGVTSIGNSAFYGCTKLTSITIPDGVTSIGAWAFYNCTGLTSVTIGDGVTNIGGVAFSGCTGLTSITIPNSVTSIGNDAFADCTGLTEINWNAVSVADLDMSSDVFNYAGTAGEGIAVTFGDSVRKIPAYLFYAWGHHPNITSVIIGSDVTSIGDDAFIGCTDLTSVTIGAGVTSIGYEAFRYCTGLTSVTIGEGVTSIGRSAFEGCTGLTEINWNAVSVEDFYQHANDVFDDAGTAGDGITVTFGESVQRIPAYAFDDCDGLTSVTIGEGVTSIGDRAFHWCSGLTEINWNAVSVADLGSSVFDAGTAGDGITVTFGDSVEMIPAYAFYSCDGLTSVAIGDSVTSIGRDAFKYCENIATVNYMGSYTGDVAGWCGITFANAYANPLANGANLYIRDKLVNRLSTYNLSKIPDYAFYGCIGISEVIINSTLTSIGESAFENCYKLVEIYNRSSLNITMGSSDNGYIGYYARRIYVNDYIGDNTCFVEQDGYRFFYQDGKGYLVEYCGAETDLVLPDSFKVYNLFTYIVISQYEIYPYAFSDRTDITSITISDSVTSIGDYAFYGCTNLIQKENGVSYVDKWVIGCDNSVGEVTLRNDTVGIGNCAFYNCSGLTSVTIPDGVTSIGYEAFRNCTDLTSVAIGDGVTSIGYEAFRNCTGLTSVAIGDGVTSIGYSAFSGCTGLTSITIPNSVKSIGDRAFYECMGLTSVTIPDSVTSIGDYAFSGCTGLTSVTIGDGVTSIGDYAFEDCTGLTSVTIGAGVTSIGDYAFYRCTGLTSITIPDSVTSIGDYAFYNCRGLTSVTIGNGVTSIGDSAFSNCYKLVEVYNKSSLSITAGSSSNGNIGYYAKNVYTAEGGSWLTDTSDGYCFLYDGTNAYLIGYYGDQTELTLPASFTAHNGTEITEYGIYDYAFRYQNSITSVTIPDGVTSIGDYAFEDCTGLTSVAIGDSVTSIGNYAFEGCTNLIQKENGVSYVDKWVIDCDSSAGEVTLRNDTVGIGNRAFYNCSGLTSVTIPDSVTSIGDYAFDWCTG